MLRRLLVSKRERLLFIIVAVVIIASLSYSLIIDPLYNKLKTLEEEIEAKEIRLTKNIRLIAERDAINEEFNKYSQQLKVKSTDEEEMASVLSEIERIGKSSGVYLNDVKPQPIKDNQFYRVLSVEIKFQASPDNLSKFIYDLQSSPFLLKVKRLQIISKGQETNFVEGNIQISKISIS